MSHFSQIRTEMSVKDYVLRALTDMGFQYEEGEELQVHNFGGQKQRVDIKVKLPLSYDVGLRLRGAHYEIVGDWFGVKGIKQQDFTEKLKQRYAYHATRAKLETQGFDLVEEKVEETGQIRLVLRRMA